MHMTRINPQRLLLQFVLTSAKQSPCKPFDFANQTLNFSSPREQRGADPLPMPIKKSDTAWNGYRFLVVMGVIASVVIYTMGAILTGIAYRTMDSRGIEVRGERVRRWLGLRCF